MFTSGIDRPHGAIHITYKWHLDTDKEYYHPKGCMNCRGSGYSGRVGLFEVVPISSKLKEMIGAGQTLTELPVQAQKEKRMLLLDAGLKKVDVSLTSLEEVLNTCMAESGEEEQQDAKIEAGLNTEMNGQLAQVLTALTENIVESREMRSKIVSAMICTVILLNVAIIAIIVMLWKVVPVFADFFTDFDSELPAITQKVIEISEFLQAKGYIFVIGLGVAVFTSSGKGW
jgi:type II secretory pathway component PulF